MIRSTEKKYFDKIIEDCVNKSITDYIQDNLLNESNCHGDNKAAKFFLLKDDLPKHINCRPKTVFST